MPTLPCRVGWGARSSRTAGALSISGARHGRGDARAAGNSGLADIEWRITIGDPRISSTVGMTTMRPGVPEDMVRHLRLVLAGVRSGGRGLCANCGGQQGADSPSRSSTRCTIARSVRSMSGRISDFAVCGRTLGLRWVQRTRTGKRRTAATFFLGSTERPDVDWRRGHVAEPGPRLLGTGEGTNRQSICGAAGYSPRRRHALGVSASVSATSSASSWIENDQVVRAAQGALFLGRRPRPTRPPTAAPRGSK